MIACFYCGEEFETDEAVLIFSDAEIDYYACGDCFAENENEPDDDEAFENNLD